ncbi:hypothetical protein [Taro reovirus 1]|nr:hypothetical protein [Taro reovirus 1]
METRESRSGTERGKFNQEDVFNSYQTPRQTTVSRNPEKFRLGERDQSTNNFTPVDLCNTKSRNSKMRGNSEGDRDGSGISILSRLWCFRLSRYKAKETEDVAKLVERRAAQILEDYSAALGFLRDDFTGEGKADFSFRFGNSRSEESSSEEGRITPRLYPEIHRPRVAQSEKFVPSAPVLASDKSNSKRRDILCIGTSIDIESSSETKGSEYSGEVPEFTISNYEEGADSSDVDRGSGFTSGLCYAICESVYKPSCAETERYELSRGICHIPDIVFVRERLRRN